MLITEVQTGSSSSSSEEFVEIYNSSDSDIDVSGWSMYYKSATGSSWTKKATVVSGSLKARGYWLFAANLTGDTSFSSGLSGTGGNLQIKDKLGNIVDQFGWGSANASLGTPATVSGGGQSMYRLYDFETLNYLNTDNNFADFDIADQPTPSKVPQIELAEVDTEPLAYPSMELSELFPDPESPLVDSSDEFIEIFNPSSDEVDLSGWVVKDESGASFLIKDRSVPARSWLAIYAKDSKLTLNNTGDVVQLVDPNGKIQDESADYGNAEPGLSWSKIDGVWQWAVAATPGLTSSDIFVEDISNPTKAVAKVSKASTKKTSSKVSPAKNSSSSKVNSSALSQDQLKPPELGPKVAAAWWAWLLVVAGIATIGYAIYEYRTEIQLFIKKLRGHGKAR